LTKRIGIISDTHGLWDEAFERYFSSCDEIWHAGDIGNFEVTDKLNKIDTIKAVYGNIDHKEIRQEFPEDLYFKKKKKKILITQIAGKLGNYYKKCQDKISSYNPTILLCGHSHICKVSYNERYKLIYINPGAAGIIGFHKVRTIIRLEITKAAIENLEVIELKRK